MSVLLFLIPLAIGLGLTGLVAFVWSLHSGQFDDLEGAAVRILEDHKTDQSLDFGPDSPINPHRAESGLPGNR